MGGGEQRVCLQRRVRPPSPVGACHRVVEQRCKGGSGGHTGTVRVSVRWKKGSGTHARIRGRTSGVGRSMHGWGSGVKSIYVYCCLAWLLRPASLPAYAFLAAAFLAGVCVRATGGISSISQAKVVRPEGSRPSGECTRCVVHSLLLRSKPFRSAVKPNPSSFPHLLDGLGLGSGLGLGGSLRLSNSLRLGSGLRLGSSLCLGSGGLRLGSRLGLGGGGLQAGVVGCRTGHGLVGAEWGDGQTVRCLVQSVLPVSSLPRLPAIKTNSHLLGGRLLGGGGLLHLGGGRLLGGGGLRRGRK